MKVYDGFTLIELLVVILVISILSIIVIEAVENQLKSSALRQASSQVVADIERARSAALKTSQNSVFNIAGDGRSYSLNLNDGSGSPNLQLPGNVVLKVTKSNASSPVNLTKFTFTAPYATIGATGLTVNLSIPNTNLSNQFYIMGVTGKVNQ